MKPIICVLKVYALRKAIGDERGALRDDVAAWTADGAAVPTDASVLLTGASLDINLIGIGEANNPHPQTLRP